MVSVIIPTYRGSKHLKRAIDSVLNQTYKDYEIIVVDDNVPLSEERLNSEIIIEEYIKNDNFIYIKHEFNMNGAAARNTGLMAAKGEYISFLDDDDSYESNRLLACTSFLASNCEYSGVITGIKLVNEAKGITDQIIPCDDLSVRQLLIDEMALGTGSNIFLKTEIAKSVEGFDVTFIRRQDIEFMIRICSKGKIGVIKDVLVTKYSNGNINVPDYKSMKEVLRKFSNKFQNEISQLPKQINYREIEYRNLLRVAFMEKDKRNIKEAAELLASVSDISIYDKFKIKIYYYGIQEWKVMIWLKKIKINYKRLVKCNGYRFFKEYISRKKMYHRKNFL